MTTDAVDRCPRCGWTDEPGVRACRGCGRTPYRVAAVLPLPTSGYRRASLIGTISSTPKPLEMPALQPFWFIGTAAALVGEGMLPLSRAAMAVTAGGVAVTALIVHTMARVSRTAGFLAPIRMHRGIRVLLTDDAGAQWILHFLPLFGTDLDPGDPAFAEGHRHRDGEFRALMVTNIRTGQRHFSRWAVASVLAVTSVILSGLVLGTAPG
ncbi:hypothetical protein VMT65_27420 [Nocardia sp. CDC153]|uniref:hypothetical protein n=1 Tax=Nocardia sp. CDC153 TaxID=3112167 RepID=UPI002DBDD643|nr:hypothetical protein [Nocardia sp. CDC153]MEC3956795.1 hypothetical protein [Nocardia sp. CDC153]